MRSVCGVRLDCPRQQRTHCCFVFLSPLTHRCLLDSPQQQPKQTLPLPIRPHHIAAQFERHTSDSTSEKAHHSSASSSLPIPLTVNPRVSIYASATAQCYANCYIPSPLKWTKSSLPGLALAMTRYYRMTTSSESQALGCSRLLRRVSSVYLWSCRKPYSNT